MSKILTWLRSLPANEPAALAYGVAAAAIPVLTVWLGWSTQQTAGATAILTALASLVAAFQARPVAPTALIGGAVAIVQALAAFHVTIPAADLSMYEGLATAALGLWLRGHLTPVASGEIPAG